MARSAINQLDIEFQWFQVHVEQLQADYPKGGHAVVKDEQLVGVWHSRDEALSAGLKAFGNVPFLVRSIFERDAYQVHFSTDSAF